MEFSEKKTRILNALIERNGLQYLVNIASEVFDNPVFVFDLSYKILAQSNSRVEDVEIITELFPNGHLIFNNLKKVEEKGVFEQLMNDDKPVFGQFEFFPRRFLGGRIRDKSDVVGFVTIIENQKIKDEDLELLVILCKCVLFEMLYLEQTVMQKISYFSLLKDILEKNVVREEVEERVSSLRLKLPAQMRLIQIKYVNQKLGLSIYYIRDSLVASLPSCYSILYNNSLLLILNNKNCSDTVIDYIRNCLSRVPTAIGISRKFDDIMLLLQAYVQSEAAIRIGRKMDLEKQFYYYDDIVLQHFFEIASNNCNPRDFCDPAIEHLREFDLQNHTDLKETLEVYLSCGKNIKKAAEQLFVHQNTLYYRVQKIEELCGINLKDEKTCFSLQFSFQLLKSTE